MNVEIAVGVSFVSGFGDCRRDDGDVRVGEVLAQRLHVSAFMHGRDRGDDFERIAFRCGGDQRVDVALRVKFVDHSTGAAGESGDAPLGCVRCVFRIPGLMGAGEVADAQVDDADRRGAASVLCAGQPRQ